MPHIEERSGRPCEQAVLVDRIRVPCRAQSGHQRPSLASLECIHRIQVKVAKGDALLLGDRIARRRCRGRAVCKLREIVIDHGGHNAFTQIVIAHVESARILAELEGMAFMYPYEVVVDLPLRNFAALGIRLVVAANRGEGCVGTAPGQHDGEGIEHLRVVVGQKQARIPAHARVELIDHIRRENTRVPEHQRPLRLRRIRVEDRIDRIGVCRLQAGILLEAVPDAIVCIDGVVDLDDDQIFAVAVVHRLGSNVRATRAVEETGFGLGTRQ